MTVKDAVRETRRRDWFSRALATALILAILYFIVQTLGPQTVGEQIRRTALKKLADHYPDLRASIRRGHYDPQVGLILEGIRFASSNTRERFRGDELASIGRLFVFADLHPEKLLDQQSPVRTKRILMEDVRLHGTVDRDGNVSLQSMFPPPQFGPVCPLIELRRVNLKLSDRDNDNRPIDVDFDKIVIESAVTSDGVIGKVVSAEASSDAFRSLQLKAKLLGTQWDVRGTIHGVTLNKDLFERLPTCITRAAQDARALELLGDVRFMAAGDTHAGTMDYQCRTTIHDGRLSHERLPFDLTQIRGVLTATPTGVRIEASQAAIGDAICRVSGQIEGHHWPANMNLAVSADGLWLDERLSSALPERARLAWERLRPVGRVNVNAQVSHSDGRWRSDATVLCNGVDISFEGFPYPVQQLVGRVEVRDGIARSDAMDGRAGGRRMRCAFQVGLDKAIDPRKSIAITLDGPVAIDASLVEALSPRGVDESPLESFVRSLQPRGSIHLASALFTTDASGQSHRQIDMQVLDGHLRYDKFAYPLYNVDGRIQVDDSLVKIIGFRATNANAGIVLCDGTYRMPRKKAPPPVIAAPFATARPHALPISGDADQDSHLSLSFRAANVPMDESLRSSVPAETQQTWDALSPSGVLDELTVQVLKTGSGEPLELDITAKQHATAQITNRTLSLRPSAVPYRLDITGGIVHYDGTKVTIQSLNGRHDLTHLFADGVCQRNAMGRWLLELNVHSGSRLNPDAELVASLPQQMSDPLRRMQLRGPVNIRGRTQFQLPNDQFPNPIFDWELDLQLEGNRIGDVGPVHSLRGEISTQGHRDDVGLFAAGNVRLDSMHIHNLQLTSIRGPYTIDGDRLRLGSVAMSGLPKHAQAFPVFETDSTLALKGAADTKLPATDSSSIQGKIFGGVVELDGELTLASSDFDISVSLIDAKVPTLLAEVGHGGNSLAGTVSGQARFDGKLGATDLLKGNGAGRLTGANLYQLPFIVQLLNQLRITPTEGVAFTDGEVEFAMFGDTITLSRLQFWGDLVALDGSGTVNRRHEVDLTFNTRVSPQNTFTRILQPLGSQRYTLWTIDVTGPMESPIITPRALEGVGQTIGRFLPYTSSGKASSSTESNRWFR